MSARDDAEAKLRAAPWLNDPRTQRVFAMLPGARAVGGVVRDTILGRDRDNAEIDFATELLPDDVMRRAADAGVSAHPTGIEHGTVTLAIDGLVAEVTTLREDIETDGRRAVVKFGTDWAADAARRDFTMNALYADAEGKLFDPLGGIEDALAGRVRYIGDADQRIAEDRLRVYRFFRFSASHGGQQIDAEGLAAVTRAAGDLGNLSAERVGAEMKRILGLPKAAIVLRAMVRAGVLEFSWGQGEPKRAWNDTVLDPFDRLEEIEASPTLGQRLALLAQYALPAQALRDKWRLSRDEYASFVSIKSAANLLEAGRLYGAVFYLAAFVDEAAAVAGASAGSNATGVATLRAELAAIPRRKFPVDGDDLIAAGWPSGRALAEELNRSVDRWIESRFTLTREELLAGIRPYGG